MHDRPSTKEDDDGHRLELPISEITVVQKTTAILECAEMADG